MVLDMPYARCPNCGDSFHLNVAQNVKEWNNKFPVSDDGNRYMDCFYCWKELEEYDVVEICKDSSQKNVSVGDKGTIVLLHSNNEFEVECVNPDGTTKWLHTMPRNVLKYVRENSR